MLLKNIYVCKNDKIIINTKITENDDIEKDFFSTVIIGENGVGKSFFLKVLSEIFIFLDRCKHLKRRPKILYDSFIVEYLLDGDLYKVVFDRASRICALKNGEEIIYKDIELPSRVLAVSFMVNDKFLFSKNEDSFYKYLGVRSSSNSTYTSSVENKLINNLIGVLCQGLYPQVMNVLSMIGLDKSLSFVRPGKNGSSIVYDSSSIDEMKTLSEVSNFKYCGHMLFAKNGNCIEFNDFSSGEKHLLFTFVSILGEIKNDSLILIDEPEISLHPEWQIKYISNLKAYFSQNSKCHFLFASHSHYLISDLDRDNSSILVYKKQSNDICDSELIPYNTFAWSAENVIYNVFGLRTTRNYYFEKDVAELIDIVSKQETETQTLSRKNELITKLQKYTIDGNDPLFDLLEEAKRL